MKRWMKWLLVSGTVCCLAGGGMAAAGAVMGGGYGLAEAFRQADGWDHLWDQAPEWDQAPDWDQAPEWEPGHHRERHSVPECRINPGPAGIDWQEG